MKTTGNTILITGGATGIGYSMAKYFHARDNTVIICGRREERLNEAVTALPGLNAFQCDVSLPEGREALFAHVRDNFPIANILINNAGIQCDIDLKKGMQGLPGLMDADNEIRVNFVAPIYLSALFTPFLSGKEGATIVNVSSGLAFMVEHAAAMPVYCATKAGMHAFSQAQRKQLEPLGIRIVEIIPPMVESELNLEGRKKRNMLKSPFMMPSDEFVEKALAQMEQGTDEIRLAR